MVVILAACSGCDNSSFSGSGSDSGKDTAKQSPNHKSDTAQGTPVTTIETIDPNKKTATDKSTETKSSSPRKGNEASGASRRTGATEEVPGESATGPSGAAGPEGSIETVETIDPSEMSVGGVPLAPDAPNAKLALLVDKMDCVFCHLEIHGDLGTIGSVDPMRADSVAKIFGRWLIEGDNHGGDRATLGSAYKMEATGGIATQYANSDKSLPVDATGKPAFPDISFEALEETVAGTLKAGGRVVNGVSATNLVLLGTMASPIEIDGDVLVKGDVIVKGVYTGRGTIYATGNIYVPANLVAMRFPDIKYSDDRTVALQQGKDAVTDLNLDALGLATAKSIFIADLENYADHHYNAPPSGTGLAGRPKYWSIYDKEMEDVPPEFQRETIGVNGVYGWYPGGEAGYEALYENVTPCIGGTARQMTRGDADYGARAFDRIDAFLYAKNLIGGTSRGARYTIYGGVIARGFHVISAASFQDTCRPSELRFDYRFAAGLPVLRALAPFFN